MGKYTIVLAVLAFGLALAIVLGPFVATVMMAAAMLVCIITEHTGRRALAAWALLWCANVILTAWLWRIGFERADANLPSPVWVDLWPLPAAVSLGALIAFWGAYVRRRVPRK